MKVALREKVEPPPRGVALILVMLAILVLSVLAAAIIFSARSETFASYNYRISTQADYVAKAGLQKALNFFNSDQYKAVDPSGPDTTYQASQYATTPVALYNATTRTVKCIANCPSSNRPVILAVDSSGNFNGNYPTNFNNTAGETIPTAFASRFYNVGLDPLGSSNNSGQFTVSATLEEYYTVNDAFYPTINRKPYEVWLVTSTGTWNSNLGAGTAKPTSVQEATLAPVYLPYFANALYGMCDITLQGTVCTDSYNSANGAYSASGGSCVNAAGVNGNAYASGAGIGSGGNVTLNGGAYTVNGDVSYGSDPPSYSSLWACATPSSGVTGSVGGVTGTVQPVPAIPEPPMPTFPACTWYGGSGPSCSKNPSASPVPPTPSNLGNGDYAWAKLTFGVWYYEVKTGGTTTDYLMTYAGWSATTNYTVGTVISPGNGHAYSVTTAGLSGTSAPAWPTGAGATVTDGGPPPNWAATTAYTVGAVVQPSPANGHAYKAISAGTSGPTQPAFPTTSGTTVSDSVYPSYGTNTSYAAGTTIAPGNGHIYTVQTGGYSLAAAPAVGTWPTTSGATATQGGTSYTAWNNQAYTVGTIVRPTTSQMNGHIYIATNSGNATNPQPSWPTGTGSTVVNGGVTWREVGSDAGITWREVGTVAVVVWQEVGPNTPVTWRENGATTNILGAGTSNDPFRLPAISAGTNANVCLTGGSTPDTTIYYDIADLNTQGTMYVVNVANQPTSCPPVGYTDHGYAVFNIYQTLNVGGQGIANGGMPPTSTPSALVINVYNGGSNDPSTDSVTFTGQANVAAVITALGNAKFAGSGAGGAFWGSLVAGSVVDAGKYSVHYDQSLKVLSGKLMPMAIRNYNRPKF